MSISYESVTRFAAAATLALGLASFCCTPSLAQVAGHGASSGASGPGGSGCGATVCGNDVRRTPPKPVRSACADREPYFDRYGNVIGYHNNRLCRERPEQGYAQ